MKPAKNTKKSGFSLYGKDNVQETSKKTASSLEIIACDKKMEKTVDEYCQLADELKVMESLVEEKKQAIVDHGLLTIAERAMAGQHGNVKLQGNERLVSFILQNNSRGMASEDVNAITDKWGKKAATLFELDPASVKLNSKYLAENPDVRDQFEAAIATLGEDVLRQIFTPIQYKAIPTAIEDAAAVVKTADDLAALYADMKLVKSVKTS